MRDRTVRRIRPAVRARFVDAQFIQNKGQLPDQVRFVARQGCMTAFLSDTLLPRAGHGPSRRGTEASRGERGLRGRTRQSAIAGLGLRAASRTHELHHRGRPEEVDHRRALLGARSTPDVLRGVSVDFHHENGVLEYDVLLTGGASPEDLAFRVEGAEGLSIDESGALIATTAVGTIRQDLPAAYRVGQGGRRENVACRFRLLDTTHFGFELPGVPPGVDLVIDPILTFAGYLSGSNGDEAHSVTVDSAGATYVAGRTASSNYPKTTGAFDVTMNGAFEGFVSKINAADGPRVLDLPRMRRHRPHHLDPRRRERPGAGDRLDRQRIPDDHGGVRHVLQRLEGGFRREAERHRIGLVFATYVGGDNEDIGNGIAVDSAGNIYVAGQTHSTNFPTTAGAYDASENGNWDAFLVKLNPTATALLYGTHLRRRGDRLGERPGGRGRQHGHGHRRLGFDGIPDHRGRVRHVSERLARCFRHEVQRVRVRARVLHGPRQRRHRPRDGRRARRCGWCT